MAAMNSVADLAIDGEVAVVTIDSPPVNALSQAVATQNAAVADARRSLELSNNRYVGGVTSYLDVITAQSALLTNQRLATQLLGRQMVTSVYLVKALGGGWDGSQIQNEQVHPKAIQAIQQ